MCNIQDAVFCPVNALVFMYHNVSVYLWRGGCAGQ